MSDKQQQYTYRNTSDVTQALIGVGQFEPGETFTTFEEVSNPNFTLVTTSKADKEAKDTAANDAPEDRTLSEDETAALGGKGAKK